MRQKIDLFHIFPRFLTTKGVHTQVFVMMSSLKSFSTGQDYHKEEDNLTIGWRVACIADKEQVEKLLAPPPMMPTLDPVHELETLLMLMWMLMLKMLMLMMLMLMLILNISDPNDDL